MDISRARTNYPNWQSGGPCMPREVGWKFISGKRDGSSRFSPAHHVKTDWTHGPVPDKSPETANALVMGNHFLPSAQNYQIFRSDLAHPPQNSSPPPECPSERLVTVSAVCLNALKPTCWRSGCNCQWKPFEIHGSGHVSSFCTEPWHAT